MVPCHLPPGGLDNLRDEERLHIFVKADKINQVYLQFSRMIIIVFGLSQIVSDCTDREKLELIMLNQSGQEHSSM